MDKYLELIIKLFELLKNAPAFIIYFISSILLLNMFWFISIFLFHKHFYLHNNIGIILTFTFALSVTWYSISTYLTLFATRKLEDMTLEKISFSNGVSSLFYIVLLIAVFYFLRTVYNKSYTYLTFLLWTFGYNAFLMAKAFCFPFHPKNTEDRIS